MYVFVQLPPKIYLARRDNGLYCDVKEACIYKKKQRRGGCQSWRTLIRLFLSFPIHTLYQWHSSSAAFVYDRDQIDFHTLSQDLQVLECEEEKAAKLWLNNIFFLCLCSWRLSVCLALFQSYTHIITAQKYENKCLLKHTETEGMRLNNLSHISLHKKKKLNSCISVLLQPKHNVQHSHFI